MELKGTRHIFFTPCEIILIHFTCLEDNTSDVSFGFMFWASSSCVLSGDMVDVVAFFIYRVELVKGIDDIRWNLNVDIPFCIILFHGYSTVQ